MKELTSHSAVCPHRIRSAFCLWNLHGLE